MCHDGKDRKKSLLVSLQMTPLKDLTGFENLLGLSNDIYSKQYKDISFQKIISLF